MKEERIEHLLLKKRSTYNPKPFIIEGGDCGACALGGLFDMKVKDVYDYLYDEPRSFSYLDIHKFLSNKKEEGKCDFMDDLPKLGYDEYRPYYMQFGLPSHNFTLPWYKRVKERLDDGYIGICSVNFKLNGHIEGMTDHWVLIVGYEVLKKFRTMKVDGEDYPYDYAQDNVIVSCSAHSTPELQFVNKFDFLKYRGGWNAMFVRIKQLI